MSYRIGVDVGGTFTDFVLVDDHGHVTEAKTSSTPMDPSEAVLKGLQELADSRHVDLTKLLAECSLIIHGTTVALNALIQLRGAKTGLICTEGFRDTLEIRLGYRDVRYDFRYPPPPILVPRHLRLPVRERIDKNGQVAIPMREADVYKATEMFRENGVESVAVCLLWSFSNQAHERRIGEIIRKEMPSAYVSLSVDAAPQIREYDRTSTTVLNAYVGPRLAAYVQRTEDFLRELGFRGEIRYVQSNGGLAAGAVIRLRAVLAVNSGPAAAPAAAIFFGRRLKEDNLITVDMGGTSFDACLIDHGEPDVKGSTDVHRYRLAAPMVNINTIGAGGGSIAWIDHGILRIGPQSAEAMPGPACYMRGGTQPTVTDADVVLGYLSPRGLLGGRFKIDASLAHKAVEDVVARPLGMTVPEAALGIFEIVNRTMASAISEISLQRGYDPRDFTLVAAGGQGPLHAAELARELSIPKVIIPRFASTFCAFGALAADLRHDYKRSFTCRLTNLDVEALERTFREMERIGNSELALEGAEPSEVSMVRRLEMRYAGQIYEVAVDVSSLELSDDVAPQIQELLHRQHEKEYTYRHEGGVGEIINASLTVIGRLPEIKLPVSKRRGTAVDQAFREHREMLIRGDSEYRTVPVYDGSKLLPGNVLSGPAVIEEAHTTILLLPEFDIEVTPLSSYLMKRVS
jgi:N-methylhydantoinase A